MRALPILLALLLFATAARGAQIVSHYEPAYGYVRGLSWDGTSLWVMDNGLRLHRHDPQTFEELWSIFPDTRSFVPEVFASDGRHLWGCRWPGLQIAEIDPADGSVLRQRSLRSADGSISGAPSGLVWKNGELWLLMTGPTSLYRVDPSTGEITRKISIGVTYAHSLAWDGAAFWIFEDSRKRICEVDPATGAVLSSIPGFGEGPYGLAWDGHYLWVASGSLYKFDVHAEPCEVMRELRSIPWGVWNRYFDVEWVDGSLWLSGTGILLVNPDSSGVDRAIGLPGGAGASGIAFDGASLWSAYRFYGGALFRLDPSFGQVLGEYPYDGNEPGESREPMGMTFDGARLWIADIEDGSLHVDSWPEPTFERRLATPGPRPAGVAWDGAALWESDHSTGLLSRLDPQSGAVLAQYRLPVSFPFGIAADRARGTMWALDDGDGRTVELAYPPGSTHLFDWTSATLDSSVRLTWKLTEGGIGSALTVLRGSSPDSITTAMGPARCQGGECEFIDPNPLAGSISYYRIRFDDFDGTSRSVGPLSVAYRFSYSPLIALGVPGKLQAAAYPNPSSGGGPWIWGVGGRSGNPIHARIVDVRGRLVHSFDLAERSPGVFGGHWDGLDSGGGSAPSGVYFAIVDDGAGARTTVRIVILR